MALSIKKSTKKQHYHGKYACESDGARSAIFFSGFLVKDMFWQSIGAFFSFPPLAPEPLSIDSCMVSRLKMRFFSLYDMRFPTFCIKFSKFPKFSKFSKNVKFGFLLSRRVQRYPLSGVLWGKMLTHLWSAHSCTVKCWYRSL